MGFACATIGPKGAEVAAIDGASFFFDVGPEPSRGEITIAQRNFDKLPPIDSQGWNLSFFDGVGGSIVFRHIFYDSIFTPGPGLVGIRLMDSRYNWEHLTYTGILNHTYDDNETYNTQTINGTDPWQLTDIVDKLIDALRSGPKGTYVHPFTRKSSALKDFDTPSRPIIKNFQAEFLPAGHALQGILNTVGGLVSIDIWGHIRVTTHDDDAYSSQKFEGVLRDTLGDDGQPGVRKPKRLKICFRILREKKLGNEYWEAVMPWPKRDPFGKILEGDDVGVPGEWGTVKEVLDGAYGLEESTVMKHFFNLKDFVYSQWSDNDWAQTAERHITAHFYKHFRYKAPTTTSEEAREQILPFHSTSATYSGNDDDEKHFTPIYSDETYAVVATRGKGLAQLVLKNDYLDPHSVKVEDQNVGIITFTGGLPACQVHPIARNYGKAESDFSLLRADISVVITYIKKFVSASGLENDYYVPNRPHHGSGEGFKDTWTKIKGTNNGHTHSVVVDDVYYIEKNTGSGYEEQNKGAVDLFAEGYAKDYFTGFIKKPTREVVTAIIPKINHLDNGLRSVSFVSDPTGATIVTMKFHDPNMANPAKKNYIDNIPSHGGCGDSISAGAMRSYGHVSLSGLNPNTLSTFYAPEDIQFKGLMAHCADLGKQPTAHTFEPPPDFQAPNVAGMVAAEDIPAAGGSGRFDRHSLHCRVHAETGPGTPHYIYPAPFDYAYHHTTKRWNPKLISKVIKNQSRHSGEPDINSPAPAQTTPIGGKTGGDGGNAGGHPRGHGITASTPMAEGGGGNTTAAKTSANPAPEGNTSTFIYDRSDEIGPSNKGALNNVLMLDLEKKCGSDPEGNT